MFSSPNSQHDGVFVSYASRDRERVTAIAGALQTSGVPVWRDEERILGGDCYGPAIVSAIRNSKALIVMCTEAAMSSKNVNQEIRLAWKYDVPYIPLLLDRIRFREQVEYWLEGWQWIEVLDRPRETWLPPLLRALERLGLQTGAICGNRLNGGSAVHLPRRLAGLRSAASFTDRIWPVSVEADDKGLRSGTARGLGASQPEVCHTFLLGSRVRLVIESEQQGHLLLLDEGPEGKIYCLCPSLFAPKTLLELGRSVLPQSDSTYDSFLVTGQSGREHLLAIVTNESLGLDWMPKYEQTPARLLDPEDISGLTEMLWRLPADHWTALATFFDVTGG